MLEISPSKKQNFKSFPLRVKKIKELRSKKLAVTKYSQGLKVQFRDYSQ